MLKTPENRGSKLKKNVQQRWWKTLAVIRLTSCLKPNAVCSCGIDETEEKDKTL